MLLTLEVTLFYSDKMSSARWVLQESWGQLDETLPQDSLMYGGLSKDEARQVYTEIDLRSYLETLSQDRNE